jgi:riboflavin synthase
MFNGIIYKIGKIKSVKKSTNNYYIGVEININYKKKDIGASVSCNGACLTIAEIKDKLVFFYISKETLNRTNLKFIKLGDFINIENSITYGQKISGHFIQGHVDSIAVINKINFIGKTWLIKLSLNKKKLSKFLIEKASISINGVSLTISKVKNNHFEINIIPHTLKLTNLKQLKVKTIVNVELDIFAKYILKISK